MDEKLSQYLADHCQTVNPGGACIFIGDIHGQFQKLKSLFSNLENFFITNSIQNYWENASIIFLGDYQDRGKYGKETIDFLSHTLPEMYPKQSHYFILGNHDFAFMSFLDIIESDYEDGKPEYDLTIYIEHHENCGFQNQKMIFIIWKIIICLFRVIAIVLFMNQNPLLNHIKQNLEENLN